MSAGLWVETPVPIIFSNGPLIDGQHRLLAVVESGCSQWFQIVNDAPQGVQLVVDQGRIRSAASQLSLTGALGDVSHTEVAIARSMRAGVNYTNGRHGKMTTKMLQEFISLHREAITFSVGLHGSRKGLCASIRAVLARAWYTQDRDMITAFVKVYVTGVCPRGEADSAAAVLAKWVSAQHSLGSDIMKTSTYKKTQRALKAFIDGVSLAKLYDYNEELYPIPGEPGWDKVKAVA
jgi:hypothetical protein